MGVDMSENLKKFREFVEAHPQIKNVVKNKERTWQEFYEDYIILGPYDSTWNKYTEKIEIIEKVEEKVKTKKDLMSNTEFLKTAYNYVKKIDANKLTNGLGNAQKVLNIFQGFVGGATGAQVGSKKTGDPLFDKKFF
jgi:hypothetical protein